MAAPALATSSVNSSNSQTESSTINLTINTTYCLVVMISCAADAGEIPQFVLSNTSVVNTLTTEDETIVGGTDGTIVYKDGTSSTVAYHKLLRTDDSTGAVYIWSIKVAVGGGASPSVKAKWTKNGTGTSYKSWIGAFTSAVAIPTRASRFLSAYSHNGTATGSGNYSVTRDGGGTSPTMPSIVAGAVNAGGTNTTPTVDFDKDSTADATVANGQAILATNQANFFFYGLFDTSDAHLINASDFNVNFGASPTAHKAIAAVVLSMGPGSQTVTATDSAPASDAITTRTNALLRTIVDNAPASDTVGQQNVRVRSASDSAPATDSLVTVKGASLVATDSAPATDSLAKTNPKTRTVTDSAACTDVASVTGGRTFSFSDTAHATDSIASSSASHPRAVSDNAHATDVIAATKTLSKTVTDNALAFDAVTVGIVAIQPGTVGGTWTGGGGYIPTPTGVLGNLTATDSAPCTDSVGRTSARTRTITDSATATDSLAVTNAKTRAVTDSAAAADSLTRSRVSSRSVTDSAPATDVATKGASPRARSVTDNAPATDALIISSGNVHGAIDNARCTDSVTRGLVTARQLSDSALVTDIAQITGSRNFVVFDFAPCTDIVTRTYQPASSGARDIRFRAGIPVRSI